MKIYLTLFWSFFKIGLFTFGGGYAMLPLLQKEIVSKGWASDDELLDYYAIGQVTPGIIAINVSTFVGYKIRGLLGAVATMIGMITPSIIIISTIASGLSFVADNPYVQSAFAGIRLVIPALMLPIAVKMIKKSVIDYVTACLCLTAFVMCVFGLSPVWVILASALVGFAYKGLSK